MKFKYIKVIILFSLFPYYLYSEAEQFEFSFEPDDILIVDQYQKVKDSKREREEKNRIYLSVKEIKDQSFLFNGTFTIYTRFIPQEKSFRKEQEYPSQFQIQRNGEYHVEDQYKFPNIQNIPSFPDEVPLPQRWQKPAKEIIYIPDMDLKIIVPFIVQYKYAGTEERTYENQKILTHKILYEYTLNHKVTPGNGPIKFIKGSSKGMIYFSTDLKMPVFNDQNHFYEFILKNQQVFQENFHIQSWYKKIKKVNKDKLLENLKTLPEQVQIETTDKGIKLDLKNVLFDFNSYELKEEAKSILDSIYETLKQFPDREIQISGHTDNIGSEEYNKELSEKRAKVVSDYLIQKGLNENQVSYRGYGSSEPIVPNDSPENRSKNRRVEILILTE